MIAVLVMQKYMEYGNKFINTFGFDLDFDYCNKGSTPYFFL